MFAIKAEWLEYLGLSGALKSFAVLVKYPYLDSKYIGNWHLESPAQENVP